MSEIDRHDVAEADAFGQLIALEAAIVALLQSAPDRDALASAWRDAEDVAFTQTSEANGIDAQRHAIAKKACVQTLARLREVVEHKASR